jgi:hypothetical protein
LKLPILFSIRIFFNFTISLGNDPSLICLEGGELLLYFGMSPKKSAKRISKMILECLLVLLSDFIEELLTEFG